MRTQKTSSALEVLWKTLFVLYLYLIGTFEIVTAIEESKDLTSLSLDELIGNLKVHEMIIKKDSEIVKAKVERKSLALKAKKESSDEECSTSGSEDEEYAMAVRDFNKSKSSIRECPKPPRDKNQRAFVGGSWSDSGEEDDEKIHDETCLVAQAPNEICLGVDLVAPKMDQGSDAQTLMGNRKLFSTYPRNTRSNLIFGSNLRGYSQNSKAYIILNKHTRKIKESLNVTFDETPPPSKTSPLIDDDLDEEEAIREIEKKNLENVVEDETLEINEIVNIKESRNHPLENVIGNLNQRTLRSQAHNQSYNQQEGIDYDETYAPVARLESIRILLAYAYALDFKLFKMDVKSAFLNGFINEEFEMSMMGELNFFLGLQIKQMEDGIFFNQSKYIKEMLKKFGLEDSKPMKTPMSSDTKLTKDEECESVDSTKYRGMIGTTHLGLWYPKGTGIETVVYADSDHAGDYVDRKSTSGICTFVGCCLTSWFLKKQTALAISTTEAEYVSAGKACQQALWMKQALIDYDVRLDDVPIMCDNKGAIDLSKNPVQHSRTKHIEIRHYFLRNNI
ncbi:copia protein [Tanacetum coccineum]